MTKIANKTQANRAKPKSQVSKKKLAIVLAIAAAIIVAIALWFARYDLTANYSKSKVLNDTSSLLTSVQLPGSLVHNMVEDENCTDDNSVGLANYVHCEIIGRKFYRHNGDISKDLRQLDSTLKNLGFEWKMLVGQDADDLETALKGTESNLSAVYNGQRTANMDVSLDYYRADKTANDARIGPLIAEGAIVAPEQSEYIYGITVTTTYYECRDGLFRLPCPAPPSEPK